MRTKVLTPVLLLIVGCLLGNCERRVMTQSPVDRWLGETDRLKVLSTTGMIDDLVAQVAGETVARLTLIGPALDPHSYELVKGDGEKLESADVIFCNGLGLEHGASLARYLADVDRSVAIGDCIVRVDPSRAVHIEGELDPHIWTDVLLWREGVDVIVKQLSTLAPAHADRYQACGAALKDRLLNLHRSILAQMDRIPEFKRFLVSSHDAFNYFSRRYLATDEERYADCWEHRCTAPEGISPEGQLSTGDIQGVIDHLVRYDIEVLFAESNLSQDAISKIVDAGSRSGLMVRIAQEPLYADAMGEAGSGADTYETMMAHNATTIAQNLR